MVLMMILTIMVIPFQVLAGKRMTPAKLEKLYAQYKGTVSAKDQMRDLQSARRVLAR